MDFLKKSKGELGSLYVLAGDEGFLKRRAFLAIRQRALGEDADEQAVSVHAGDKITFSEVFDELDTLPFFYAKRVILIDNADPFVTKFRAELEKKIKSLPTTGLLVLDVKTWASNTRLAKMVDASATISCKAPAGYKMASWCTEWAKAYFQKELPTAAANLLVEHVGPEMGLLDQELAKLAVYVGARSKIEAEDVDKLVGQSRGENTWKIFDAIGTGNVKEALAIVGRLFEQGEEPMRLLGAFSAQLRKLAQAGRFVAQNMTLTSALEKAGVPPFGLRGAEQQMRHLGRNRVDQLLDWLLELNLDLRGNSQLPHRALFERFVIRLAHKAEPPATPSR